MRPEKPLPISDEFSSAEEYVEEILRFASNSDIFQLLCGGVHILDFFTNEPGLFYTALPQEWQEYLLQCEPMVLLDVLMRDDLESLPSGPGRPPESLIQYVKDIRRLSLRRTFSPRKYKLSALPQRVAMGMKLKKIHEVANFAGYVDSLADGFAQRTGKELTHFVDFGSGQNYLGRALAGDPYNRHIVAVEGRESNIDGARRLDVLTGVAEKEKVMRNKKLYMRALESLDPARKKDGEALKKAAEALNFTPEEITATDLRPTKELQLTYTPEEGKGSIRYVIGQLENADLKDVVAQLREPGGGAGGEERDLRIMAMSIHSCGNLSHYGIRSLILNPCIRAVAIVGCCYNLMTEKLGPPAYKTAVNRPSLQAVNGRVVRESERRDPQGFPMSERFSSYGGHGIRLNITARMMACQAPLNWGERDSDEFFARHFYRAVLQKIFLDKGVISRVYHGGVGENGSSSAPSPPATGEDDSPFNSSTNPVIIGSLRKSCYGSLGAYVRGAIAKLTTNTDYGQYSTVVARKMGDMSDAEIDGYEERFQSRKRELSAVWSLMAFSACVVESLVVTDRWAFLREHQDTVADAWVEAVFDYKESPRNLVVVGIKK
ncbi:methyltransferase-like protein 25 [Phialemonium atrogriseum]|uniref:Methyltransferase-like protein 25 n=1 Tax=Phialemonium atrogriseum TaxID=1093897 RepID=A0AAJ0BXN7_9PEZI|nr:methyltransferase-like protein 25 [Phialemonium atrogriseum]KAK1766186.1 methyltransferase-like protein 25 [Phialemonium atrogriseum]